MKFFTYENIALLVLAFFILTITVKMLVNKAIDGRIKRSDYGLLEGEIVSEIMPLIQFNPNRVGGFVSIQYISLEEVRKLYGK